jgi:nicotinamidase-related amidase
MATPLADLVTPSTTAVITMELQRGVGGDLATMPILADAVDEAGVIPATAAVLQTARAAGAVVVHCTFTLLPDRSGTPLNAPLIQMLVRNQAHLLDGTPAAEVVPGLLVADTDLVSNRHHGFSPFTGTDLDGLLRDRGIETVVVTGMSLNLGIPGTVIEAVNLGYRVVVVRDCVAGMPAEYGDSIIQNTLAMVATITTAALLTDAWSARAPVPG